MLKVWLRSRREGALSVGEVCRTPLRVNLGDLDIYRHVNNGTYLTIADLGRFEWMLRTGLWRRFGKRGWYPVVAAQTTTYRKSLEWNQHFILETRLLGLDSRDFYLEHRFVANNEIYARIYIRARIISRKGRVNMEDVERAVPELQELPHCVPEWIDVWHEATRLPSTRQDAPSVWDDEGFMR